MLVGVKLKKVLHTSINLHDTLSIPLMWGGEYVTFSLQVVGVERWKEDDTTITKLTMVNKDGHSISREYWTDQTVERATYYYKSGDNE